MSCLTYSRSRTMEQMETTTDGRTSPEDAGETSKAGLRRMQRLAASPLSLHECQTVAFHPTTSTLLYHSTSTPVPGFAMTPILQSHAPRPVPFPPMLSPPSQISTSPDGQWIIVFHPNIVGQGGNLAIYSKTLLSPLMDPANVANQMQANLPLDKMPLQILPLYPPRMYSAQGKAPQVGPKPLPKYTPDQGPVLLVLTSSSLLLIHPHPQLPMLRNGTYDASGEPRFTSTVLRAPLNMRWRAVLGDQVPLDSGYAVERGWMGLVAGNDAAWVAVEKDGEVNVIRAEVGIDRNDRWYLATTPLPPLSLDQGGADTPSSASLQNVCFTPSPNQRTSNGSTVEQKGVAVVVIQSLSPSAGSGTAQTRIFSFSIQRQKSELVESFAELSGQSETTSSWDWFVSSKPISSTISPPGLSVEAMQPLPSVDPYTQALALTSTPEGLSLTHLDLAAASSSNEAKWQNLVGHQVKLDSWHGGKYNMRLSQGALRGMIGLIAVEDGTETTLVISPRLQNPEETDPLKACGGMAYRSVVCAIHESSDWADVFRAAFGSVPKASAKQLANEILLLALSDDSPDAAKIDDRSQVLRLQIAIFSSSSQSLLRDVCAEMLRFREASNLFAAAARFDATKMVSFDQKCVWPLVTVAEWAFAAIASIFRDVILAKAGPAKEDPSSDPQILRALQLLVPHARSTILLLLSQLRAFASFVARLDEPIPQPETRYMPLGLNGDSRATILAKDRMASVAQGVGVDVEVWGKELQKIQQASLQSPISDEVKYILLHPETIHQQISSTLSSLPAPSWLFIQESDPQTYDSVTFQPIPEHSGVRCDRCQSRTVSLFGGLSTITGANELSAWERWIREREEGCGCGGCWVKGR